MSNDQHKVKKHILGLREYVIIQGFVYVLFIPCIYGSYE